MAYIYRHIRLNKNEPFYIGIGSEDNNKYNRAHSNHQRNKYWNNIISQTKYRVDILCDDLSWEEACKKETFFISYYGRKDLGLGSLVNMTDGGEGSKGPKTEEHKQKISLSQKGIPKLNLRKPRLDTSKMFKPHKKMYSTEKMKVPRPGSGLPKRSIIQHSLDGIFIREWDSKTQAEKETNIKGIANVLTKISKTAGGFIWRYKQ
jgi:hypothetical protein